MNSRRFLIAVLLLPLSYLIGADYVLGGAIQHTMMKNLGLVATDTPIQAPTSPEPSHCESGTNKVYNLQLSRTNGTWHLIPATKQTANEASTPAKGSAQDEAAVANSYQIITNGPTLILHSLHPDQKCSFSALINGMDNYYSINNNLTTDLPTNSALPSFRAYEQEDYLPIFGYHFVVPDATVKPAPLEIRLSDFIAQVDYAMNVMGCRWYTFGDIMRNYVLLGKKTPRRACVMTFDDGHRNNYDLAYPVLLHYGIKASFYIILGRVGLSSYMGWSQIDQLYANGQEIGSHTISHNGAIVPGVNLAQVVYEVANSKDILVERGYHVLSFAYPLGRWDAETVLVLKNSKYLAARDSEKPDLWRDPRAPTTSMDSDFVWHMYYHKPDQHEAKDKNGIPVVFSRPETGPEMEAALGYNNSWQFEDGFSTIKGLPVIRQLYTPTPQSYGVVELTYDASIANSFIVSRNAHFTLDIFGAVETKNSATSSPYSAENDFSVYVDGVPQSEKRLIDSTCITANKAKFCHYLVDTVLAEGKHTLTIESNEGAILLDKFIIFRELPLMDTYQVQITENVPGSAKDLGSTK